MEEKRPPRVNKAKFVDAQDDVDEPAKAKRVRNRRERSKAKRVPPASTVVVLQRVVWGGLFGLAAFNFLRYESLLQREENTVFQEISLSGIFLVEMLIAFIGAFALCQVLKLWATKEPVEVFMSEKDQDDME